MLASPDAGVIEITDEELQKMFDETIGCENPGCTRDATWRVWAEPCMCSVNFCTFHKMRELARFRMDKVGARCHKDPSIPVTDLKAEPL